MTKWAILLTILAIVELTFGLYIWTYEAPLPSDAMFTAPEALEQLSGNALLDLMNTRGPAPTPRDAVVSYATAVYLKEYGVAYLRLSSDSKAAFEKVGGAERFGELHANGFTYLDLGRALTVLQTETEALVSVPLFEDPAWMNFWLFREEDAWRVAARPSNALVGHPAERPSR